MDSWSPPLRSATILLIVAVVLENVSMLFVKRQAFRMALVKRLEHNKLVAGVRSMLS